MKQKERLYLIRGISSRFSFYSMYGILPVEVINEERSENRA